VTNTPDDRYLKSWSHAFGATCRQITLNDEKSWMQALQIARREQRALIPRGGGLSWTDITMMENGLVASTAGMSGVTAFDAAAGEITVRGGTMLRDILETIEPQGWTLRCLPGSLEVTLGGAIACNVHGKDTHHHGAFCEQLAGMTLLDGRGERHRLVWPKDATAMDATAGGMGLTGLVAEAVLKLTPLPGTHLGCRALAIEGSSALRTIAETAAEHDFLWGWLDPTQAMAGHVHALATLASWAPGTGFEAPDRPPRNNTSVRNILPWGLMAPLVTAVRGQRAMSLLHRVRRGRLSKGGPPVKRHWRDVLFPHARIQGLNRLFARSGFAEVQAIVPLDRVADVFNGLGAMAPAQRLPAFLVSFKVHRASPGLLTFAGDGLGLSFVTTVFDQDMPTLQVQLGQLRNLLETCGGRINLHRDGTIPPAMARRMYPGFSDFATVKHRFDPDNILRSGAWMRLSGAEA
jgi:decaprenylphospho-beta-D-ribofuranose 2-oxidase